VKKFQPRPYERRRWLERGIIQHSAPEFALRPGGSGPAADLDLDLMNDRSFRRGLGVDTCTNVLSWSRNLAAFYTTAQGTLVSYAANVPRIGNRGLLNEGASTNIALESQTFGAAVWTKTNTTITADDTTAPDGTSTADKWGHAGGLGAVFHSITLDAISTTQGTAYTISFYAKASVGAGWIAILDFDNVRTYFNLLDGTVGTQGAGITSAAITPLDNGWFRIQVTRTKAGATGASPFGLTLTDADNTAAPDLGSANSQVRHIWGAQLEALPFVSSYIPTTTVAVTRPSEQNNTLIGTGTCIQPLITTRTLYSDSEFLPGYVNTVGDAHIWELNNLADRSQFACFTFVSGSGTASALTMGPPGFTVKLDFSAGGIPGGDITRPVRVAFRTESAANARLSALGQTKGPQTNDAYGGVAADRLIVGSHPGEPMWGHIRRLAIWNSGLSDDQLDQLSDNAGSSGWTSTVENTTPTVDVDFVGNRVWSLNSERPLTPLVTCTRALGGYAEDTAGILHYFEANVPRITTKGLLHERASTNEFKHTSDLDAIQWGHPDPFFVDTIAAPDGTLTGALVLEANTNDNHQFAVQQIITMPLATVFTISFYAKRFNRDFVSVLSNSDGERSWFNIANGTVTEEDANHIAAIVPLANGWYRCSITFENTETNNIFRFFVNSASGQTTYQGDVTKGAYFWGPQVEEGYFPTSYIATAAAAVTRPVDQISLLNSTFGTDWNARTGTYYVDGTYASGTTGTWNPRFVSSAHEYAGMEPTGRSMQIYRPSLGYDTGAVGTSDLGVKVASAFTSGARSLVANGGTPATDTESFPLGEFFNTELYIGQSGGGSDPATGFTRRVIFWRDAKFLDATITTITT